MKLLMVVNRGIVTSTNRSKEFTLRLGVPHESIVVTSVRQIFKSLHPRMMRHYLVVVIVELLDHVDLLIRIRVAEGEVLERLVQPITVHLMVVPMSLIAHPLRIARHRRLSLARAHRIVVAPSKIHVVLLTIGLWHELRVITVPVIGVFLWDLMEPRRRLLMNIDVLVLLHDLFLELLGLVVHHSDVDYSVSLESGDIEIDWRSIAYLLSYHLDVIHYFVVLVLNRGDGQANLLVTLLKIHLVLEGQNFLGARVIHDGALLRRFVGLVVLRLSRLIGNLT